MAADTPDAPRVITHDGYRANERPMAVISAGERFDIIHIEDSYHAAGVDTRTPVRHGYTVRCRGGARFQLVLTDGQGWNVKRLPGPVLVRDE
ncbi:MAG: hypothetical protein R6V85_07165 [Polyangia bacterium]